MTIEAQPQPSIDRTAPMPPRRWPDGGPSALRGILVIAAAVSGIWWLSRQGSSGTDEMVSTLGKLEVTARLLERPETFPQLGAYRYTYVLKYEVLQVHRADKDRPLKPGDIIFVGHYKPWLPRSQIKDSDWGDTPLGGKLDRFNAGEAHRMALDYNLEDIAPSGVLDYCFPIGVNRFFALWTNPTSD